MFEPCTRTVLFVPRSRFHRKPQDQDGGLNFSEMLGMLRRMGMRGTQNAMATELEYIRALKVRRTHIGGNRWSLSISESDRRRGRRRRPRPFVTASSRSCFLRLAPIRTYFMHALKIGFISPSRVTLLFPDIADAYRWLVALLQHQARFLRALGALY